MTGVPDRHAASFDAGLQIETLVEHAFLDWSTDFLVESSPGRYALPPDAGGELPLMFWLRARKPS